jgi:hypothetical protein
LVATFPVAGTATAADFSLDSRYLWVAVTPTGGTTSRIYVYTSGVGSTFFTTSSLVNDLAFLANGPLVYLAGDTSTASITARATCLGGQQTASTVVKPSTGVVDVQPGFFAPSNIRALPSGAAILALDLPDIDVVTLTNPQTPLVGCPPALPQSLSGSTLESVSLQNPGLGSPAPTAAQVNQFLVMPNSSTAVLTTTNGSNVFLVSLTTLLTTTTVPLVNSAVLQDPTTGLVFKGDIPADSSEFVVGGNDGDLHEIIVGSGTDSAFSLSGLLLQADGVTNAPPNLVAIQNQ